MDAANLKQRPTKIKERVMPVETVHIDNVSGGV
jgi:hypothetical protein